MKKILVIVLVLFLMPQLAFSKENCENVHPTFQDIDYILVDLTGMPESRASSPDLKIDNLKPIFQKVISENLSECLKNFDPEKSVYFATRAYSTDVNNPHILTIRFYVRPWGVDSKQENLPDYRIMTAGFYRKTNDTNEIYHNLQSFQNEVYFPGLQKETLSQAIEVFLLKTLKPRHQRKQIEEGISGPIIRKYP